MTTAELYIDQSVVSPNPVAAVVVEWASTASTAPLLAEAVIVGSYGTKSISFVSRGESQPSL